MYSDIQHAHAWWFLPCHIKVCPGNLITDGSYIVTGEQHYQQFTLVSSSAGCLCFITTGIVPPMCASMQLETASVQQIIHRQVTDL